MTDPAQQPPADDALLKAQEEIARLKDMAARAQADLQNAKIRLEKEAQDMRTFAVEGLVKKLLPTIDNFQRAFAHLPEELRAHDWVKGVQATEQELMRDLEAVGLSRIEALGKPVDPQLHEVLQAVPGEKDAVVQVYEAGYMFNGRVLKPAKVVAGNGETLTA